MKPNDGCALEILLMDGQWVPLASRYLRFTAAQQRALDLGLPVTWRNEAQIRRYDWAVRQALQRALRE